VNWRVVITLRCVVIADFIRQIPRKGAHDYTESFHNSCFRCRRQRERHDPRSLYRGRSLMMYERLQKFIALTGMIMAVIVTGPVLAAWSDDPTARTPICTAEYQQYFPQLVAVDGGFIATWNDQRRGSYQDVYAQKFSILGEMLWPENGRVIAEGPAGSLEQLLQVRTGLAHDGDGGALIAWGDIIPGYYDQGFVTKVTPDATVAWGDPGEPIQTPDTAVPMLANPLRGANPISQYGIVADSEGGFFVPVHYSLGRFDAEGRLRTEWFNHSRSFDPHSSLGLGLVPLVEPGGQDGVIVVWISDPMYGIDNIQAHKFVDPETSWPTTADTIEDTWGEVLLYDPPDNVIGAGRLRAISDGSGGLIAAWMDNRTGSYGVYAQRVDTDGNLMWGPEGIAVSEDYASSLHNSITIAMVADGEGGVVITWNDPSNLEIHTLKAQRLDANGNEQWTAGGVVVDTDGLEWGSPLNVSLVQATDGNFIVLSTLAGRPPELVVQKLAAADGELLWGEGRTVYEGILTSSVYDHTKMVSDGRGGAIIAFVVTACSEIGCWGDIYAHRVQALLLPELDIEKRTNGRQADGADDYDVPRIAPEATVSWSYEVANTGDVAFPRADVLVSDSQTGVTPVLDVASDDGDLILSPDETWTYTASAPALDLALPPGDVTIVPGCNDGRNTYENTGRVDVAGTTVFDEDTSHYCNMGDVDADGITDSADNCLLKANGPLIPDPGGNIQLDTDGDDYGNLCDPDFDNNLVTNAADLAYMKTRFFTTDANADLTGNGVVNAADLAIIKIMFFGPPGPSGLVP